MATENANKHGSETEHSATSELRSTGWFCGFMAQHEVMIAGLVMCVFGAITNDYGLSASGSFIVGLSGLKNWRGRVKPQNHVL